MEGAAGADVTGVAVTAPPPKVNPDEAGAAAAGAPRPPPPPKLNPVVAVGRTRMLPINSLLLVFYFFSRNFA